MEAIVARTGAGCFLHERRSLSSIFYPTPAAHVNSTTSKCGLRDRRNSRLRIVCRGLSTDSVSDRKRTPKEAVRETREALDEGVKKENKTIRLRTKKRFQKYFPPYEKDPSPGRFDRAHAIRKIVGTALFKLLQYKSSEQRSYWFRENFAPVDEIGDKVPVQIISGTMPQDFPAGAFITVGPNPIFGGNDFQSLLGVTKLHWFEGDGMLHATYFEKCGDCYQLSYKNKYVETDGYLIDKKEGKPTTMAAAMEGSVAALFASYALNYLRFGWVTKTCGNTALWTHGGKTYVTAETHLPYEINVSDLSTIGVQNWGGTWGRSMCTAHPKVDPQNKQLIIQGIDHLHQPHNTVGVISADGRKVVHKVDVGVKRPTVSHDILITERYTVVMDFPLVIDASRLLRGESVVHHEFDGIGRFGVLPRYGDANSVRWFTVKTANMFHMFNAYEDGTEIIVRGLPAKNSFFQTANLNLEDKISWFTRGLTPGIPGQPGHDPLKDGSLRTNIHEWRIDLISGTVTERAIDDEENSAVMEMPRINEAYVGKKHKYGYSVVQDPVKSCKSGLPYSGKLSKVDFSTVENGRGTVHTQFHDLGPDRYVSEPVFIAKPGGLEEDDGWLVSYVYDENTNRSEMIIIDAQRFTEEPVTRILLPQRVPFGFHGTYVYSGRS